MRRRVVATLCVMVLGLGLFPARADAFFWDWLDDLSGPSFQGTTFNWRVWCQVDDDGGSGGKKRLDALNKYRGELQKVLATFKDTRLRSTSANAILDASVKAAEQAISAIESAIEAAGEFSAAWKPYAAAASVFETRARVAFDFAQQFDRRNPDGLAGFDAQVGALFAVPSVKEVVDSLSPQQIEALSLGSVELSLCKISQHNTRAFLSANVGLGYNKKHRYYGFGDGNLFVVNSDRMVTLGLSYHSVVTPYLTLGAGGGVAIFSSNGSGMDTFAKPYVEPYIIDVRPWGRKTKDAPWRQILAVRYSTIVFPTGFEPGRFERFTDQSHTATKLSERLPAELVHSVGLHIDLVPLIKAIHDSK